MKRYISAILVPCLLLQFFGCSSLSEIPVEELKDYSWEEAKITTKDSMNYLLKKNLTIDEISNNPDVYCSDNWSINSELENINIIYKKPYSRDGESNKLYLKVDTTNISYNDISSVTVQKSSDTIPTETSILIVVAIGLIVFAAILLSNPPLKSTKIEIF